MRDVIFDKGLPCDLEAERCVLGAMLLGADPVLVTAVLNPIDFSTEANRRVFNAISNLSRAGSPVDRVTVASELSRHNHLESVGGLTYLLSLDEHLPEIPNLDAYVNIVRDKSVRRRVILVHRRAIEECLLAPDPTAEIVARWERTIAELSAAGVDQAPKTPFEIIDAVGGIEKFLNPERFRGVPTPWGRLNQQLAHGGFAGGQMVVIGARPGEGKTAMGCQIADYAAANGVGVVLFTLEMPDQSILLRMGCARANVSSLKFQQGSFDEDDQLKLSEVLYDLTQSKLWIDDRTMLTAPAMRATLRKMIARIPIGLVVVDYLQLIESSGRSDRRYEQITQISRGVKTLSMELKLPIVVLSQLSRDPVKEKREPRPSDMRDSGAIEQDADIILFPWRRPDSPDEPEGGVESVELILAKQRNGPVGRFNLKFDRRYAKFIES